MPSLIVDALVVLAVGRRWERAIVAMVVSFRLFSLFSENEGRPAGLKFNPPFKNGRTYIGISTSPFEALRQSSCAIPVIK